MSIKIFAPSENRNRLAPFLFLSLILHLGLILTLYWIRQPMKIPSSLPILVDVIELPPTPSGKVEEPDEVKKRLAERSQRAEKETTPTEKGIIPPAAEAVRIPTLIREEAQSEPPQIALKEGKEIKDPEKPTKEEIVVAQKEKETTLPIKEAEKKSEPPKETSHPQPPVKEGKAVETPVEKPPRREDPVDTSRKEETRREERPINLFPSQERLAELEKEYQKGVEGIEEGKTLTLNTSEFKYFSYMMGIKRKIELVWTYPEVAARAGQQGRLEIRFTIRNDGILEDIRLIKSSGYSILDNEALSAVRLAAPFNPFPKGFNLERINIVATFEYIIEPFYFKRIR
ncbi:MAG: energy transducer TonB [Deltaproteobacteria bacterium]|nr:energy transducer TonB [Deltaproteobacteria bacterium]